ncbi:MAG: shikimate kinase [Desulfobacterota bacterium]|jgi:shikimate kinase|nr:shikimate kinase [Thermodesulfobacteriota bacterium]
MNIVLIGPRCSGKTTVGRLLAERTGKTFRDTDALVEAMVGKTIESLIATRGWEIFRVLEKRAVATLAAKDRQVIATGGGAVEDRDNARNLAERGFVVWLDGRPEILMGRQEAQQRSGLVRPSLTGQDPLGEMRRVLAARRGRYESIAALRIDTTDRTAAEAADEIIATLQQEGEQPHGR